MQKIIFYYWKSKKIPQVPSSAELLSLFRRHEWWAQKKLQEVGTQGEWAQNLKINKTVN